MYGFDAAGVERDGRAVDAYETFIKGWLRDKRIEHKADRGRIRRDGRVAGRRFDITIPLLQTPDAIERVAYEMVEDAARDNVRYIEVRYCSHLSGREAMTYGSSRPSIVLPIDPVEIFAPSSFSESMNATTSS